MIEVLVKEHKFPDEKMNWIIKKELTELRPEVYQRTYLKQNIEIE